MGAVGVACERFTPAPAGNTVRLYRVRQEVPVHPRACGEYAVFVEHLFRDVRFTPAPAGNTCATRS